MIIYVETADVVSDMVVLFVIFIDDKPFDDHCVIRYFKEGLQRVSQGNLSCMIYDELFLMHSADSSRPICSLSLLR